MTARGITASAVNTTDRFFRKLRILQLAPSGRREQDGLIRLPNKPTLSPGLGRGTPVVGRCALRMFALSNEHILLLADVKFSTRMHGKVVGREIAVPLSVKSEKRISIPRPSLVNLADSTCREELGLLVELISIISLNEPLKEDMRVLGTDSFLLKLPSSVSY
jgi:hypothetical protein